MTICLFSFKCFKATVSSFVMLCESLYGRSFCRIVLSSWIISWISGGSWFSLGSQLDLGRKGTLSVSVSLSSKKAVSLRRRWYCRISLFSRVFWPFFVPTVGTNDKPLLRRFICSVVGWKLLLRFTMFLLFLSPSCSAALGLTSLNVVTSGLAFFELLRWSSEFHLFLSWKGLLPVWGGMACFAVCDCLLCPGFSWILVPGLWSN